MVWDRYIEIVVNLSARGETTFLVSIAAVTPRRILDLVQADAFPVRFRFVRATGVSNAPLEVVQLAAGSVIVFTGKLTSALSGSTLLFFADAFTEDEDDDGYFYAGIINTATASVLAAFAALSPSKQTLALTVEVEIQNAGNTQRLSFQNDAILRRQVYAGEGDPAETDPEYPPPSAIFLPTRDIFVGEATSGAESVDITIPASATRCFAAGIRRPSAADAPISIVDWYRLNDTTARVLLSAATAVAGYQVTFVAITLAASEAVDPTPAHVYEGTVGNGASTVDVAIPADALYATPLGVELPAVDAAPIAVISSYRLSSTAVRLFLSAATAAANYKTRVLAPTA